MSREGIDRALDAGFELVQMARALVNDPAFVEKLRTGDASTRSACDHRNYCIARMYSVDMKCCKHCPDLPRKIVEELERLPRTPDATTRAGGAERSRPAAPGPS